MPTAIRNVRLGISEFQKSQENKTGSVVDGIDWSNGPCSRPLPPPIPFLPCDSVILPINEVE